MIKNTFKVRQPGHGDAVQKGFESQGKNTGKVESKDNSQNSGGKKGVNA